MKTVDEIMALVDQAVAAAARESIESCKGGYAKAIAEIEAALKERDGGCKYPTCHSEEYQAALTKDLVKEFFDAPPKAQPMSSEQRLAVLASIPKRLWVTAYTPQPAALITATERFHKIGD